MRSWRSLFLVLSLLLPTAYANSAGRPTPIFIGRELSGANDLPVEQWLSQSQRNEIPWEVSFSDPQLTFQLRNRLVLTAEIDTGRLQKQGIRDELRFLVKVAPKDGNWSDQASYKGYSLRQARVLGKVKMQTVIFLQPGEYRVAAIAYHPASGKKSVSVHTIRVKGPHAGVSAELTSGLPMIEFPSLSSKDRETLLPVKTPRPVQFDLIVDLSTREESTQTQMNASVPATGRADVSQPAGSTAPQDLDELSPSVPRPPKRLGTSSEQTGEQFGLLGIAKVLAELDFQPGCAQVTVLDVLRLRTILPPTPVRAVDWQQLRKGNTNADKVIVSVATLEGRKDAGKFLHEQIEQNVTQPPRCQPGSGRPLHVIAVLSHGIRFPRGSEKPKVETGCDCKVFYFHKIDREVSGGDDLEKLLEPLALKRLDVTDPRSFRDRLLEFTEAIQKLP
ncbi:MAG TPA: hypothetical protein VKE93_05925 [Candidatus Angelobacter sp.]|nr:hypothetical protein [Candidatus Angelobacter sp.]